MLKYQIYHEKRIVHSEECDDPIVLGRASDAESLFRMVKTVGESRLPVAASVDKEMSRRHALLEPREAGLRLTNLTPNVQSRLNPKTAESMNGSAPASRARGWRCRS